MLDLLCALMLVLVVVTVYRLPGLISAWKEKDKEDSWRDVMVKGVSRVRACIYRRWRVTGGKRCSHRVRLLFMLYVLTDCVCYRVPGPRA